MTRHGEVIARDAGERQPALPTGEIEVAVDELDVLSAAELLPFQVAGTQDIPEEQRLRYRFLDLRREKLHAQHHPALAGDRLHPPPHDGAGLPRVPDADPDVELAGRRARLSWCPSRMHPGKFYALPQAPQQFKQLLMVAGFDRYFQIAPCFRDEDAPRRPFARRVLSARRRDVASSRRTTCSGRSSPCIAGVFQEFADGARSTPPPFPRIAYDDAMAITAATSPTCATRSSSPTSRRFPRLGVRACSRRSSAKGAVVRAIRAPGAARSRAASSTRRSSGARARARAGSAYIVAARHPKGPLAK